MSVAWAPAGDALAAAYQDGIVTLWDTRSMQVCPPWTSFVPLHLTSASATERAA